MERRGTLAALAVTLALASCATPVRTGSAAEASSTEAAGRTPQPSGDALVVPARPYAAATLLTAMRDSRRPGGVPDRLETNAVAESLAAQIWTWNGQPWSTISVGGACGSGSCTLDVAGSRDGAAGADLYSFAVAADRTATLVTADLHAYDAALDEVLDRTARAATGDQLAGLTYVGASWLPPPDAGIYRLAYRTGGEEGSPGVDMLLDLAGGRIVGRKSLL
jgi:hypothetical protein